METVKTLIFTVLVPGSVVFVFPLLIFGPLEPDTRPYVPFGLVVMLVGAALYGWAASAFVRSGRGTPAPIDPPQKLVAVGPSRFSRNPMYVAVLLFLAGESVFLDSRSFLLYLAGVAVLFQLFIVLYEEPTLRKEFGETYMHYTEAVPRWLPVNLFGPRKFPT